MDKLPPEILCDIFLKTLPHVPNEYYIPYSESIASPLRISHVCRSWRDLALSFRELWSYLYINHCDLFRRKKQNMMAEIFDTWLARTNDGPINFMVDCSVSRYATFQDHRCAEYVLTRLIENQRRWKNMYISCYGVDFTAQFPGFNLIDMPLLTSLHMSMDRSLRSVADFSQSARLRQLNIDHDNYNLLTGGGLSHLESIKLTFSYPKDVSNIVLCLKLLKGAPSLSDFQVSLHPEPSPPSLLLDEEHVLHTGLRELLLWDGGRHELPVMVLDSVTLPSLEQFTYNSRIGGKNLLRFFQRSMPPLASLKIYQSDISEDSLISILRLLPTLKELKLFEIKLSHRFFSELVVPDGTSDDRSAFRKQVVCPLLSFLDVYDVYGWSSAALQLLLTMAKSRASVLGTFQTARFVPNSSHRPVAVASIDNFVDAINPKRGFALY